MNAPVHKALGRLIGEGRTAEVFVWNESQVVKLFRDSFPAAAARRELQNTEAVVRAGVAAPTPCGEVTLDGRIGLVFENVHGPTMLRSLSSRPWTLVRAARTLAGLHADMHERLAPALPPLKESLSRSIGDAPGLSQSARDTALQALDAQPDGASICHGDFHPDNVLMSGSGPVIIDWSTATRGDPRADLARTTMMLSLASVPPGTPGRARIALLRSIFHRLYLRRYLRLRPGSRRQMEGWRLPVAAARLNERIPDEREALLALVQRLARRSATPA